MTLEQLRVFLAVAKHLHFTNAAEELYLTQPAVSAAIHILEADYGVKLFHRMGRRIEITSAGKMLQIEAQKILDQVTLTERALRELNNLQQGELNLGSSLTIGNYWLPEKISKFKQKYPGISVNCTLANANDICGGTVTGLYDLGIIAGEVKLNLKKNIVSEIVGRDRLQIVVGQSHPWFDQPEIMVDDLVNTSWVMREDGSGSQQAFERALQNWGINPQALDVALLFNSSEMVKAVVEQGVGATALPELMIRKELKLNTLRSIKVLDSSRAEEMAIIRPILKLKHLHRFQTRIVQAFEEILCQDFDHNF
ncbi:MULTISPECIES: LysR substrate-binding domain-containing protein [unclassified Synechocystis]|uniref:LysR substrate-binding domain-containing protein n=1 Tax=unclassified Synechocystis TaxID=2640012 RepID=UPI00048CBB60|nr:MULTISPECIES: LysR substrate-binding domain-containing protein [unclassified Synechocystis]MCT0253859.1 LysR family transcriptional regulator [Synechocystis sp. CS-94]